ncbi:MAG: HD domain-containing protein [Clostridia bacterium]|nr:HD domain-containing protein [Clostridia bacterium]MBQ4397063.1 HD domain-containing protein [Clostridia bacterium]
MAEISQLLGAMISYYKGDPCRIHHFLKVHDLARIIGMLEGLDKETLFVLEAAAAVHDIAVHWCELKYGRCDGKLREQEGPPLCRDMMQALGFEEQVIERVCWLVAHHHTYEQIESIEHRILAEADTLISLYEDDVSREGVQNTYDTLFKTETGRFFCRKMLLEK